MKKTKILSAVCATAILFTGCSSDDDTPEHIHDNEEIHEFIITQTDADGNNPMEYIFVAGDAISDDVITLRPNSTYNFEVTGMMSHGANDEEENIVGEIIEEKEEHFFVYEKTSSVDFSLIRTDDASTTRADGTKIGKKVQITTNNTGSGNLTITLKHEPTSVDDSANNNFGSSVGGSSDVVATYSVNIE
ncbi:hypothetical protein GO491_03975 [Flavobacteriaceae bacterium Ap0902]|nr:hypothetical protein [Flavobacteriaceae bacterium Ap0902]